MTAVLTGRATEGQDANDGAPGVPSATPATGTVESSGQVTAGQITQFLHQLARLRFRTENDDDARGALLAGKAELFTRIADQHALIDPTLAQQARNVAEQALRSAHWTT